MLFSLVLVIGFVAACSGHASLFLNPSEDLDDAIQPVDTKKPSGEQTSQRPNAVPQQNSDQQLQTVPQQQKQQQQQQQQQQTVPQPLQFIPQKNNGYYPVATAQNDQKLQDMIAAMVAQQVVAYESQKKNFELASSPPPFETGLSSDAGAAPPPQVPAVYAAAIAAAAAAAAVQVMTYAYPSIRSTASKPYLYSAPTVKSYSPPAFPTDHNGVFQQQQQYQQYLSSYPAKGNRPINSANTPFN